MSFGYSVGDFIQGANLSYKLIKALSETRGQMIEYQEAIRELDLIRHMFLEIGRMKPCNLLGQATINSAAHIILSSIETIDAFLKKTEHYRKRFTENQKDANWSDSWLKMGWALFKAEELKELKTSLHDKLSHIHVLLTIVNYHGHASQNSSHTFELQHKKLDYRGRPQPRSSTASTIRQRHDILHSPYITLEKKLNGGRTDENAMKGDNEVLKIVDDEPEFPVEDEASCSTSLTKVDNFMSNEFWRTFRRKSPSFSESSNLPLEKAQSVGSPAASVDHTEEVLVAIPPENILLPKPAGSRTKSDSPGRPPIVDENPEKRIRKLKSPMRENGQSSGHKYVNQPADHDLIKQLQDLIASANKPIEESGKKPIRFKDAVGRKFSFPFSSCQTWRGMEELIKQAFLHVEVIGPHVEAGNYDLIGPNSEIILPQVWEVTIQPDWAITMQLWPMPEALKVSPGPSLGGGGVAPLMPPVKAQDKGQPPPPPRWRGPPGEGIIVDDTISELKKNVKKRHFISRLISKRLWSQNTVNTDSDTNSDYSFADE